MLSIHPNSTLRFDINDHICREFQLFISKIYPVDNLHWQAFSSSPLVPENIPIMTQTTHGVRGLPFLLPNKVVAMFCLANMAGWSSVYTCHIRG